MSRCVKCGLFSALNSECFWFKKKLSRQDLAASSEFHTLQKFFTKTVFLSPLTSTSCLKNRTWRARKCRVRCKQAFSNLQF